MFLRPDNSGGLQVSLRGHSTPSEITDLGLEGFACSSELDQTRLQIGLLLTSCFHAKCQIARLRLAPDSKFFVISVSLQTLGLDLRLQICQELYDLVHWIRPRKSPDTSVSETKQNVQKQTHANAIFSQQIAVQSGPRPLWLDTMNMYKRNRAQMHMKYGNLLTSPKKSVACTAHNSPDIEKHGSRIVAQALRAPVVDRDGERIRTLEGTRTHNNIVITQPGSIDMHLVPEGEITRVCSYLRTSPRTKSLTELSVSVCGI